MNKKLEKKIDKTLATPEITNLTIANLIKEEMWELQEALCNNIDLMYDDSVHDYITKWVNKRYKQ